MITAQEVLLSETRPRQWQILLVYFRMGVGFYKQYQESQQYSIMIHHQHQLKYLISRKNYNIKIFKIFMRKKEVDGGQSIIIDTQAFHYWRL
jgi:hypothetical protein